MAEAYGNVDEHRREMAKKLDRRRGFRYCPRCPGKVPATHVGLTNGLAMTQGCEWHMRLWVKNPHR